MNRRHALGIAAFGGVATALQASAPLRRMIPRSGETIPVIGMGTWLTFDVGDAPAERARRARVLDAFFAAGGGMIDSSPMYGRAEQVVGDLLAGRAVPELFSATKIWTPFERRGLEQVRESLRLWQLPRLDLVQVHNLVNARAHLKTLWDLRARAGLVRYIGVTTSHGRRHDELRALMRRESLDFVQLTYSVADPSGEDVLALAADRGIAVIANRPFDGGALVDRADRLALPAWASEIACSSWAQVLLKWIVSHPAVACAIPATTDPKHMAQNMWAGVGPMPDPALRRRIFDHLRRSL